MDEQPKRSPGRPRKDTAQSEPGNPRGPDGVPNRRRYPALGIAHRQAVPRDETQRAEDVE